MRLSMVPFNKNGETNNIFDFSKFNIENNKTKT